MVPFQPYFVEQIALKLENPGVFHIYTYILYFYQYFTIHYPLDHKIQPYYGMAILNETCTLHSHSLYQGAKKPCNIRCFRLVSVVI